MRNRARQVSYHVAQGFWPAKPTVLVNGGYIDQSGNKWVKVRFKRKAAFAPLNDLVTGNRAFYRKLADQGVVILKEDLKGYNHFEGTGG